jgi:hypothetical protein
MHLAGCRKAWRWRLGDLGDQEHDGEGDVCVGTAAGMWQILPFDDDMSCDYSTNLILISMSITNGLSIRESSR